MPWEERKVSQMREEFVRRVLAQEATKSALCREYNISRVTGDKWIKRYKAGESLEDQSRKPNTSPRRTNETVEQAIVQYRQTHKAIGAVKIRKILQDQGIAELPSSKTVHNILVRNGLVSKEESRTVAAHQRFQKAKPNEMWQGDYKGHFAMQNGQRCHPLNIIDDCSRFNLCCEALQSETFAEMQPVMIRLFENYGMPETFLCDNGNPWGTAQTTGFTNFEIWLMELGILTVHGRPRHPQTQGKEESFNRAMTKELLKQTVIADLADAQRQFDEYREFYNNVRPHHALNLDKPSEHYTKSIREYSSKIARWEYPAGAEVRRVKSTGYFTWNGHGYFLSESFGGKEIMIQQSSTENCIKVIFRDFQIAKIDIAQRGFIFRRAYRIENDPRWDK